MSVTVNNNLQAQKNNQVNIDNSTKESISGEKQRSSRMKILLLAPHPYYQNRGTPIDVDLVLKVLSERGEEVDMIAYHEGSDVDYDNLKIYRTPNLPFIKSIRPGFSWKKVICDIFMFFQAISLISKKRYNLIHAGEEAVFIALVIKILFKIPYVYDMDSSVAQQMVEKYPGLKFLAGFLNFCEGVAVKNSEAVVPVCDALSEDIQKYNPKRVVVLHDISLLQ
ncbi:MAG: glycosyltransferase family 4 protein [Coleofasciculaceae cyanobacterium]